MLDGASIRDPPFQRSTLTALIPPSASRAREICQALCLPRPTRSPCVRVKRRVLSHIPSTLSSSRGSAHRGGTSRRQSTGLSDPSRGGESKRRVNGRCRVRAECVRDRSVLSFDREADTRQSVLLRCGARPIRHVSEIEPRRGPLSRPQITRCARRRASGTRRGRLRA